MTRAGRLRRHLVATYLAFDPRSLALFRIAFGLVLLLNLGERFRFVDLWYTNDGLVPVGYLLGHRHLVSLFFLASTRVEALVGMALCAVAFVGFTLGYRTRLFHLLSLIALVSLDSRTYFVGNSGDWVMNLLCFWSLFLPLGRRFSIDALVASLRRRRETTPADLEDRSAIAGDRRPVVSLAVLALLLQFAAIYLFSAVHKTGSDWTDGSAVYYALHLNRLLTGAGLWVRETAPYAALQLLAWGTLVVEYAAVALLLSPVRVRPLRRLAMVLLPALHLGFGLCLEIGVFSHVMIAYFFLLPDAEDWKRLAGFLARRTHPRVVYFDAACGICFQTCRLLARLDPLRRLRFVPNDETDRLPRDVAPETAEATIVVEDEVSSRIALGGRGVASILAALPGLYPLAAVLRLPGIAWLADRAYDAVSRRRSTISGWLGLNACGRPAPRQPAAASTPVTAAPPVARWANVTRITLREATVTLFLVASFGDVVANAKVPAWMRYEQPARLAALVAYPRLRQHWWMFAPAPTRSETTIAVEATTRDGRPVDPYNERVGFHARLPPDALPARLGYDRFNSRYALNLPRQVYAGFRPALTQWILRHHERTGRPEDRIVSFRAYVVRKVTPKPGSDPADQGRVTRRLFLKHPM